MSTILDAAGKCALFVFLLIAAAVPAEAQTTLGTIRGTVFDPQQHIVPGATVVVTDESTNVAREAQSDAQGLFEMPNLRPGTYAVTATLSGSSRRSGRVWCCAPRPSCTWT
jgi:uncharacterized protein (DUF2141 family)